MRPFLALLGREVAERRLLLLGAVFAGLFPVMTPWFPGTAGQNPADLRGGTALGLAFITSSLLALVLGATVIAQDLGERRLGFYFARPLPGWAVWAAKMSGAALLSLGAGALVLLPALMAGARIDASGYWGFSVFRQGAGLTSAPVVVLMGLGALLLLVAAHAVSVMVRARSPWLALDLAGLILVAATLWSCSRLLWREGAAEVLDRGGLGFAAASAVALSIAGLVQVVRGRTDLRRGHRLLSLTLWALMGAATAGYAAYARWAVAVVPQDLTRLYGVMPAPAGRWVAIRGLARGRGEYWPLFLLDVDSGRFVKLPSPGMVYRWTFPLFSRDGRHAVWMEGAGGGNYELLTVDLRSPKPALHRTGLIYPYDHRVDLSPDGSRLAVLSRGRLTVDDLVRRRMLAAVAMPEVDLMLFLDPGRVRLFQSSHIDEPGMPEVWRFTILDLDVARRRIVPISRIELPGKQGRWQVSPDGRRALLRRFGKREALLADLDHGRTIPVPADPGGLSYLEDGRILRMRRQGKRQSLSVLTPDGVERLRVDLPGARLQIGSILKPDLLAIATTERGSLQEAETWTSWLVDLRTGRLRQVGPGMVPVGLPWDSRWLGDEVRERKSLSLFLRGRELLSLDPATGRLRTVLKLAS